MGIDGVSYIAGRQQVIGTGCGEGGGGEGDRRSRLPLLGKIFVINCTPPPPPPFLLFLDLPL